MTNQAIAKNILNIQFDDSLKGPNVAVLVESLKDAGIAALSAYLPLALSFAVCHTLGWTGSRYPEVSHLAAVVGVVVALLFVPVAVELRKRPVANLAGASAIIFLMLGALASFTL